MKTGQNVRKSAQCFHTPGNMWLVIVWNVNNLFTTLIFLHSWPSNSNPSFIHSKHIWYHTHNTAATGNTFVNKFIVTVVLLCLMSGRFNQAIAFIQDKLCFHVHVSLCYPSERWITKMFKTERFSKGYYYYFFDVCWYLVWSSNVHCFAGNVAIDRHI